MDRKSNNYVCRSKASTKPFSFRWEIEQFPFRLMRIGDELDSAEFVVGDGVPMYVKIWRRMQSAVEDLGVYLYKASKEPEVKLDFSITIINSREPEKSITKLASEPRLFAAGSSSPFWNWGLFAPYASIINKNVGFLMGGHQLTVLVEGVAFNDRKMGDIGIQPPLLDITSCKEACEDFGKLYDGGTLSDFLIKMKDADGVKKEYKVHKAILAARSEFFAVMFSQSEVKESSEGVLEVEDIDSEAMESLLRFLYTGKIPPQSEDEGESDELGLLIAADKYGILRLKNRLERVLASKLSTENVCEILVVAERHSAPFLAARCKEFIRAMAAEVVLTDGWSQLCTSENAKLMGTLFAGETAVEINCNGNGKK